jgi:YebC/PmpR family DNA-binding regulatory protein
MSGHSHWAKIRRSKAGNDAKRGREWSKLARRIIVAAKVGGGNPDENLNLRYAIDDSKAAHMPKETIQNAIKKGTGALGVVEYEHVMYEGYGPGGVAIMVDCLTDNRHRTAPEMRKIFERSGGSLGGANCVGWMFTQKGTFLLPAEGIEEDKLFEIVAEAGADDLSKDNDVFEITCAPAHFVAVREALAKNNIPVTSAQVAMVPNTTVTVAGEKAQQVLNLMDALDDQDDVQNVYANFDIPEEVAK